MFHNTNTESLMYPSSGEVSRYKKKLFMFSRFWERWDGIHFVYCQLWKYLGSFSSADKLELIRCKPGVLGEKFKNGWTRKSRNRRDEKHSLGKERDQNPSYGIRPFGGPPYPLGKPSIVKKRFFVKSFRKRGGGVWLISYLYFIFPNTLQTHFKHPATPFKHL